jgi:hypothetical protein
LGSKCHAAIRIATQTTVTNVPAHRSLTDLPIATSNRTFPVSGSVGF